MYLFNHLHRTRYITQKEFILAVLTAE